MLDERTTGDGPEQTDPHPLIKDPVEHKQRNILRVVSWSALAIVIIAVAASIGLGWPAHLGGVVITHLF